MGLPVDALFGFPGPAASRPDERFFPADGRAARRFRCPGGPGRAFRLGYNNGLAVVAQLVEQLIRNQ